MNNEYNQREDRYELLSYNKWNRRLLNLYWMYNAIVFITEFALLYYMYVTDSLRHTIYYHLTDLILVPTILVFGITGMCEGAVWALKKARRNLIPYAMTFTCVAYCSILFHIHYSVVVLSITYVIPIIISLVYDSKSVLRWTSICSFTSFGIVSFAILSFGEPQYIRLDAIEIITAVALLVTIRLLCVILLKRNREIIDTLVETKHSQSRAEAVAEARARFLANMSHEIRTPMNGIIGLTELALDDESLSEKHKDYLTKIYSSADGLLHIVNDILDISKIDEGELKLEKIPFDLQEVLDRCKTAIALSAEEKGLRLRFITETNKAGRIEGDPTKLRQALLNLLSNAVKFTEKGLVTLTVKEEQLPNDRISVYFEISDTGIGMTEEQQVLVFEPFKQADDCTARKFGGTGLGLSITKSIVEKMGGEIHVESVLGEGSSFSFQLVFVLAKDTPNEAIGTHMPMLGGSVLVCEDNEINLRVAVESLKKLGINVTVAENGKRGIEEVVKWGENFFDVILMDIQMPIMDGFQTTKKLIDMGVKTPIIAMTANAILENKESYLQAGMVDCITKPFKLRDLWLCLSKYLAESTSGVDSVDEEVIDISLGIENSACSQELHSKMLTLYFNKGHETYMRLEKAVDSKDYALALQIVHLERGTVQIIGARRLSKILIELEVALKSNAVSDCNILMTAYKTELDKVLNYISER